jgi:hypothetical protein
MGAVIDLTARRAQQLAADGVGRIVEDQPAPQPATEAAKAKDTAGTPATTDASNKNAPFEVVVAICKEILEKGEELTKQRKPDLEAVRFRVKDAGYDSEAITAAIRDKATEAAKA